jgi:hypothetical protein
MEKNNNMVGIYVILVVVVLGFIYLALLISNSDDDEISEGEINEIKGKLLQDLDDIEKKLDDIENVPNE